MLTVWLRVIPFVARLGGRGVERRWRGRGGAILRRFEALPISLHARPHGYITSTHNLVPLVEDVFHDFVKGACALVL